MNRLFLSSEKLKIEFIPIEFQNDMLPSVRVILKCSVKYPSGILMYRSRGIWFDIQALNEFSDHLEKIRLRERVNAFLECLSQYFSCKVSVHDRQFKVELFIREYYGMEKMFDFETHTLIDVERLQRWKEDLIAFRNDINLKINNP